MTESALPAFGGVEIVELVNRFENDMFDPLHHELRDPFAARHLERFGRVRIDQKHLEFTPIAAVDESWRVEACHAVFQSESAPGLDEPGEPFRDRDGKTGGDKSPTTGTCDGHRFAGHEIEAGIAHAGIDGQGQIRVKAHSGNLDHVRIVGPVRDLRRLSPCSPGWISK